MKLNKKIVIFGSLIVANLLYGNTTSGIVDTTQPVLVAVDEHGNIDTDYVGSITLSKATGSGTVGGTVIKTAVSGTATYTDIKYSATADNEVYTLTASDGALTSATTANITSEVIATQLSFTTQPNPTSILSGEVVDFTTDPIVKAVDADDLVDTDFTELVTLGENGNGVGTFTNNTATAVAGVATLTGLTLNHSIAETMKLTANDVDGTGSDLPLGLSSNMVVTSNSVPVNTLPTTQTINQNSSNTLIAGISIADGDSNDQTITLTVTNGTLSLNGTTDLTFTTGDGTGDASMEFSGTLADVNAALNNLTFTPTTGSLLTAELNLQSDDGQGGQSDDSLTINVVDTVVPTLLSIVRNTPTTENTNADTLVFKMTFSEEVTNLDASDLVVSGTSATVTNVAVDTGTPSYFISVVGGDLATYEGTVGLDLKAGQNITDGSNNALATTEPATDETYSLDNTAPTTPVISITNGTTITGTGEVGATLTVIVDNNPIGTAVVGSNGAWTFTPSTPLANDVVITATQEDTTGNVSGNSENVTVDSSAPTAPVINLTNGTTITGTGEAGATVTVIVDNSAIGTAVVGSNGAWTFTPSTPLANDVVITATQEDTTGNVSVSSGSVTVDSTDSDATLTEGSGVTEPVKLPSTADTEGEAVALFDFTLTDGGTADGFTTDISEIILHTSGTADFTKVTWKLNGDDATAVTGVYDSAANTLTFSGLSISIANGTNETYTVSGFFSTPTGLTENQTYILAINGDDDLTVDQSKTKMSGSNDEVNNDTGTKVDIVATTLKFMVLPSN